MPGVLGAVMLKLKVALAPGATSAGSVTRFRPQMQLASPVCYADEHYFGGKT